jgi:hypothetical protein
MAKKDMVFLHITLEKYNKEFRPPDEKKPRETRFTI